MQTDALTRMVQQAKDYNAIADKCFSVDVNQFVLLDLLKEVVGVPIEFDATHIHLNFSEWLNGLQNIVFWGKNDKTTHQVNLLSTIPHVSYESSYVYNGERKSEVAGNIYHSFTLTSYIAPLDKTIVLDIKASEIDYIEGDAQEYIMGDSLITLASIEDGKQLVNRE